MVNISNVFSGQAKDVKVKDIAGKFVSEDVEAALEEVHDLASGMAPAAHTHDASDINSGTFDNARIAESNVTQHEGAIDHDALTNFEANEHIDWTVTGAEDIHDDRIQESSVTQHESALSITESQISDLGNYQDQSAILDSVSALGINGILSKNGTAVNARTITAGTNKVTVNDGDGVAGNPTIDVDQTKIDHDQLLNYAIEQHRIINDSGTSTIELLSSQEIRAIVSAASEGVDTKDPCETSTEGLGNITLSGEQTLNGVLTSNSRVAVVAQSLGEENGFYVTSSGAWTRTTDADTSAKVTNGMQTDIVLNPASTKYRWKYKLSTPNPIVLGTTPLSFVSIPSPSFGTTTGTMAEGNDSRIPTQDENDALVGTNGTPSTSNKYVTNSDPRNSNSRTPTTHASSHTNGTDDIQSATASQKGLMTTAYASKLDGIAPNANNYAHPNHSGEVTSTGDGATVISNNAVTNAKAADMVGFSVKVKPDTGTGDPTDFSVGTNSVLGRVAGNIVAAPLETAQCADNAITYAKIQDISAASRLLGRGSAGGAGDPEEIILGTNMSMAGNVLNSSGGITQLKDDTSPQYGGEMNTNGYGHAFKVGSYLYLEPEYVGLQNPTEHDLVFQGSVNLQFDNTSGGVCTVTGILPVAQSHFVTIVNIAVDDIILSNNNSGSSVGNRFLFGSGANITLKQNETAILIRDEVAGVWRDYSSPSGTAGLKPRVEMLAHVTGIDMKTVADTTLYTPASGKKVYVTDIVVIPTVRTAVTVEPTLSARAASSRDIYTNFTAPAAPVNSSFSFEESTSSPTFKKVAVGSGGDVVKMEVSGGATATTYTASCILFGYEF